MVKKSFKIISILILLALIVTAIFFYSIYVSVGRVNLTYNTISSKKIPVDMNNLKIAFISDIKYNNFMDKERLSSMIDKLNKAGTDILIFGGDIYDAPDKKAPDSQTKQEITEILKSTKAPLGKFAVLGDQDNVNDETRNLVSSILYDSDFEIIMNNSIRIRNKSNSSITLIGVDSMVNGTAQTAEAFQKISNTEFNIMVTHCPDIVKNSEINTKYLDLILSGHSLGGQIYLPVIGPLRTIEGAESYNHGSYTLDTATQLYVSNGLGTIRTDMRLFSPPEILIFRLQSKAD